MNKIKVGDTIQLKSRTVRHHVKNLSSLYTRPGSQDFIIDYASEVAMFLGSYLKKANKPAGKVVALGSRLPDDKNECYLMVKVANKFGKSEVLPLLEKDVILVRRKDV